MYDPFDVSYDPWTGRPRRRILRDPWRRREAAEREAGRELAADSQPAPPVTPAAATPLRERDDPERELSALRQRLKREAERELADQKSALLERLLPVLDNLERTIVAAERDDELTQGVTIVRDQLESVLASYGLEPFDATGEPFDPELHDAVGVRPVEDENQVDHCVEQLRRGYRYHGELKRPAQVVVGRLRTP